MTRNVNNSCPAVDKPGQYPVRVLFLDHTASLGGGEIALLHLASNLDRARFTPIVALGADGELKTRLVGLGVETHVLPLDPDIVEVRKDSLGPSSVLRVGAQMRLLRYVFRLTRFIRDNKIDIVHSNSLKSDILGGLAARLTGRPIIWHVRDRISRDYLPAAAVKVFRLLSRTLPNFVIVNSSATLATLLPAGAGTGSQGIDERRYGVVHDAVGPSYARLAAMPPPRNRLARGRRVGLVGRITEWKGQDVFIRAAKLVRARFPDTEFLIIGSAMFGEHDYEAGLHRLVAECGLDDSVKFLGFRSDVEELILSLDVLVHASTVPEPFGQVVIEGMAAGTPIIATRGGGVTEIVEEGVTGTLVTMGSEVEMAEAIVAALCEPERVRRIADAARQAILERFTIKTPVQKVQAIYEGIAQRSLGR